MLKLKISDEQSIICLDESFQTVDHFINFAGVVLEIFTCVQNKDFFGIIAFEPFFVLFVDLVQILQRDLALFFSLSDLGPFVTLLWGAPQIDDLGLIDFGQGLKTGIKGFVDFVLALIHVTEVLHELCEDIFVS